MRSNSSMIKLVLLGDGRVGKTSLVLRYVDNVFSDKQVATVQASYLTKRLTVDGESVTLSIWDTAGQERFHALGPIYYRDADEIGQLGCAPIMANGRNDEIFHPCDNSTAALLVYNLLCKDSFNRVQSWVKELRKMANKNIVLVIAGNKSDMDKMQHVNVGDAERYAESIGATHFVTSAKLNTGIDEVFLDVARRVLEQRKSLGPELATADARRKSVIIVDKQPTDSPAASKCCS